MTAARTPKANPAASITVAANLWASKPARRKQRRPTRRRNRRDRFLRAPKAAQNGDRTSAFSTNPARKNLSAKRRAISPRSHRGQIGRGRKNRARHLAESTARSRVSNRGAQTQRVQRPARNIADARIARSGISGRRLRDAPILVRSQHDRRARGPARRFAAKNLRSLEPSAASTKRQVRNHSVSPAKVLAPENPEQGSRGPAESVRLRAASGDLSNPRAGNNF